MRFYWLFALTLIIVACDSKDEPFRLEGKIKNLNQGEIFIYSHEGTTEGIDTISIVDGKFLYEVDLGSPATFVFMFSNFSENVVFGEQGKTISIKGDAYNLKGMEIKGTKDNELMTTFRIQANKLPPPELPMLAEHFIRENPKSVASLYIIDRYFIRVAEPNYHKAKELVDVILTADVNNVKAISLAHHLDKLTASDIGKSLPTFYATDIYGANVSNNDLSAKVNIIHLWATWNYDSRAMMRSLREVRKEHGDSIDVVSICLAPKRDDCRKAIEHDSINWHVICDSIMWESPLLGTLGLAVIPGTIVCDKDGMILARNLTIPKLRETIDNMFK